MRSSTHSVAWAAARIAKPRRRLIADQDHVLAPPDLDQRFDDAVAAAAGAVDSDQLRMAPQQGQGGVAAHLRLLEIDQRLEQAKAPVPSHVDHHHRYQEMTAEALEPIIHEGGRQAGEAAA